MTNSNQEFLMGFIAGAAFVAGVVVCSLLVLLSA